VCVCVCVCKYNHHSYVLLTVVLVCRTYGIKTYRLPYCWQHVCAGWSNFDITFLYADAFGYVTPLSCSS